MSALTYSTFETLDTPEDRIAYQANLSAGQSIAVNETLSSSANQLVNIAFAVANLKLLYILSSQNCTIKTNSSGSPANIQAIQANKPLVWRYGGYETNLLTVDVTKFYVSPASGNCVFTVRALVDPTP